MKLKLVQQGEDYSLLYLNNSKVNLKKLLKHRYHENQLDIDYPTNINKEKARNYLSQVIANDNNLRNSKTRFAKLTTLATSSLVAMNNIITYGSLDDFFIGGHRFNITPLALFSLTLSNLLIRANYNNSLDTIAQDIKENDAFVFKKSRFIINWIPEGPQLETKVNIFGKSFPTTPSYNSHQQDQSYQPTQEQYQQPAQEYYQNPTDLEDQIAQLRNEIDELESN